MTSELNKVVGKYQLNFSPLILRFKLEFSLSKMLFCAFFLHNLNVYDLKP